MPLLRSTISAKASNVEASRGRIVYDIAEPFQRERSCLSRLRAGAHPARRLVGQRDMPALAQAKHLAAVDMDSPASPKLAKVTPIRKPAKKQLDAMWDKCGIDSADGSKRQTKKAG